MDLRIAADPPPVAGPPCPPAGAEEGAATTASPQGSLQQVSVLERARRAALGQLGADAQAPSVNQLGQAGYADVLAARPAPSPAIRLTSAGTAPARTLGYAPAPVRAASAPPVSSSSTSSASSASSASKTSTSSSTSQSASTKSDFAFLSDTKLSIQDKLFQFMLAVQKKEDQQLQKKMKQYADKYGTQTTSSSSSTSKASGIVGALGGLVEDVVGGALSIFGLGGSGSPLSVLGDLAAELGGTVLAGALTAVGLPELVPVAASIGSAIGGAVKQATGTSSSRSGSASSSASGWTSKTAKASTSTSKTTTSKPSAPSSIDAGDERLDMLEIQRMVEKQNQMFQLISNMLAGMNDTAMNVIANVR